MIKDKLKINNLKKLSKKSEIFWRFMGDFFSPPFAHTHHPHSGFSLPDRKFVDISAISPTFSVDQLYFISPTANNQFFTDISAIKIDFSNFEH